MKHLISLSALALAVSSSVYAAQNKKVDVEDVFNFKYAKSTTLSENGLFLVLNATPYRGTNIGQLYDLNSNKLIAEIENTSKVTINKQAQWAAFMQSPSLLKQESTAKKNKKKLKKHLTIVNTATGEQHQFKNVKDFQLSDDGQWLAYRVDNKVKQDDKEEKNDQVKGKTNTETKAEKKDKLSADKKDTAYKLVVVRLTDLSEQTLENVFKYALSSDSQTIGFSQVTKSGEQNQIAAASLQDITNQTVIVQQPGVVAGHLVWQPNSNQLALTISNYKNQDKRRREYQLNLWHNDQLEPIALAKDDWFIGKTAKLSWSEKGERLYFEARPTLAKKIEKKKYKEEKDLTDRAVIRDQKGLKVWHHNDPQIKPREIQQWNERNRDKHYQAVLHINGKKVVQLATPSMPNVNLHKEKRHLLAYSNDDYLKEIMYNGFFADYAAVDITTGKQTEIIKHTRSRPSLSPNGKFAAYFNQGQIQLKNLTNGDVNAITKGIRATFANDQHDYPSETPGYGFAGWSQDNSTLYAYGKYDIWAFNTQTLKAQRLTNGYQSNTQYRVKKLNKLKTAFSPNDTLLLSAHNLNNKRTSIAQLSLQTGNVKPVLNGEKRYDLVAKAKHSDNLLFTEQSYHQFPDLWQTTTSFKNVKQITNLNPQLQDYAWGSKPELIQYKGFDGEDLQGTLIKPAGYKKGDKVPVMIYFYRYMSQRMYDFPKMELNHRPNFPMYTSDGYAVFLPDIRFEIGHPGKSSTQTIINAAQKLIDLGIADPNNIGLQGHSWAGYQSAFMITQTDMFKAVVSGAPVSNMTSAYSGIRLKSGLARQFQYETGQSRIGKNLFEGLDLYIENSPVFFADKVNTPIMIMFGDKDGAVPWQEGIQYYLALQRAEKDVIFLQYEGEPHHLKKFPNQVDFTIRMKEYFDHHLKGIPAPQWMVQGEAYLDEGK